MQGMEIPLWVWVNAFLLAAAAAAVWAKLVLWDRWLGSASTPKAKAPLSANPARTPL